MKKSLAYLAIIGTAAFAGNMINIGLSYGMHWQHLGPSEFMQTIAIDFPLLLYPTSATLLPAFVATAILYYTQQKKRLQSGIGGMPYSPSCSSIFRRLSITFL